MNYYSIFGVDGRGFSVKPRFDRFAVNRPVVMWQVGDYINLSRKEQTANDATTTRDDPTAALHAKTTP